MWKLYDELIAAVPEDAVVEECLAGLSWFLVRSIGTGVAMRPREMDGPIRDAGRIAGKKLRELAAWIESNILLQLASAPFDKQDEALVPEAGSCANCPKRTGFNKLLFPDVRKDSCKLCGIRFWGWGAGEGAVPLPLLSYLEAVLTARTVPIALFSSNSGVEG